MGLGKPVKRLFNLEIDEVSLVDRPANQFGKVAFSKRAEDEMPEYFDVDGDPVDEGDLEHGDVVYDEDGQELVWIEEGTPEFEALAADVESAYDDFEDEEVDEDDRELASVGKRGRSRVSKAGMKFTAESGSMAFKRRLRDRGVSAGRSAATHVSRNKRTYGAAAGGAGAGYAGGRVGKRLSQSVYEELSKALNQNDRDEVIAKAFDVLEAQAERIEELTGAVGELAETRAIEDFSKMAESYGPLPVHPSRLGQIMKRASDTLPREDVEILDRLFTSVGDQLYTEVGKGGTGESSEVIDVVDALVDEVISKSGDFTREQAMTAIFAENPGAYDEYLAEHSAQVR